MPIKELFAKDVSRPIEEVIKVDQADKQIIRDEIEEYEATDSIKRHFTDVLERYAETPNKPHEGIAVWVSGFFGSGKSSYAKLLGLSLQNQDILGTGAADRFATRVGDNKIQVLLKKITEQIPTTAVIFDVSTDRGIRSGNQTLTEIMYRLFLRELGYARDLDLAELEITLEGEGKLDAFTKAYQAMFKKDWDREKEKVAFAIAAASQVMNQLDPQRFPSPETWLKAARDRADITPGLAHLFRKGQRTTSASPLILAPLFPSRPAAPLTGCRTSGGKCSSPRGRLLAFTDSHSSAFRPVTTSSSCAWLGNLSRKTSAEELQSG